MREDLRQRVLASVTHIYGGKETADHEYLRQIQCPACGKKEAYTWVNSPWVIRCARDNKCGAEHHVKDLFPDLFNNWTNDYPKTPQNPNAAADAYLTLGRGFKMDIIKGWYSQGSHHDRQHDQWTSTVKFKLPNGSTFERFIDQPARFGSRKGTLGDYKGYWWLAPTGPFSELAKAHEIWITEGIFNAVALMHADHTAVSSLSSGHYPHHSLAQLAKYCAEHKITRPMLVWALDSDRAGKKFTKKHVERARADGWNCTAAQVPSQGMAKKLDWNDYHLMNKLSASFIDKARYEGALLIATTKEEKGNLIWKRKGTPRFCFEFENELFWYEMKDDGKSEPAPKVNNICTCVPTILYKQSNLNTDEHWFYFNVDFPKTESEKLSFTNAQISSAAEFKKRLFVAKGGMFTGTTGQLDSYLKWQMRYLKSVETIDYIGYSRESQLYIFGDVAVKAGKVYGLNSEDFFEIGKQSIKTLSAKHLQINTEMGEFNRAMFKLIYTAFGAKGLVALSFWFGSLFAEQIRMAQESYPFLELIGEPGAGKSTLLAFLWRMCGRKHYEGFDPNKATPAARGRNMMQFSNLPTVFLEADRSDNGSSDSKAGHYDWDELKTAYNGGTPRLTGQKNAGNGTDEPLFKGSVVISQNAVVKASRAVLERIVHLRFNKNHFTPDTARATSALTQLDAPQVSGFVIRATTQEALVMSTIEQRTSEHTQLLKTMTTLRNERVIKNHAQIMACYDAMRAVFSAELTQEMTDDVYDELIEMAQAREVALDNDHPLVQEFWEVVEYLESTFEDRAVVDHSRDEKLIAINLRHMESVCNERRVKLPPLTELRDVLRTSRKHKFIDIKTVGSVINKQYNQHTQAKDRKPDTVKCWVFERG